MSARACRRRVLLLHRVRKAVNDMYYETLRFTLLWCQPEPVEGGFVEEYRLRQALPDTQIGSNFCCLQRD